MPYNISFISLGCAKNQVNCEQMMASVQAAGHTIQVQPEGADVVVVNTCGFLQSACEEAIDNILEMAELKKRAGQVQKILVTGCMTQRYKQDVLNELPEVDGILGTGSYGDICAAIDEVMAGRPAALPPGQHPHRPQDRGDASCPRPLVRLPPHRRGVRQPLRLLRDPSLRGKYRSRPMVGLLEEARELADAGVKELLVIAQDITRYGTDLNGEHQLAALLRELCRLDFHWDPAPLSVSGRDH